MSVCTLLPVLFFFNQFCKGFMKVVPWSWTTKTDSHFLISSLPIIWASCEWKLSDLQLLGGWEISNIKQWYLDTRACKQKVLVYDCVCRHEQRQWYINPVPGIRLHHDHTHIRHAWTAFKGLVHQVIAKSPRGLHHPSYRPSSILVFSRGNVIMRS